MHRQALAIVSMALMVILSSALLYTSSKVLASACSSTQSGNFNDPATWTSCNSTYPQAADTITINTGHTVTLTADTTILGATIDGGTFTLSSYTLTVNGSWTYNSGTINADTSKVKFTANGSTVTGSHSLNNVEFATGTNQTINIEANTTVTVNGTLTWGGSGQVNTGNIHAKGDIIDTNTRLAGGLGNTTITINGAGDQTLTGQGTENTGVLPDIVIDKSSGTLNLVSLITIGGSWTVAQGTVDAGTSTMYFRNSGRTITGSHSLNNVEFASGTNTAVTIASGTILTVNGTLIISGTGTNYSLNTGDIYAKGDFTVSRTGTGGGGSATITINGTGDQTLTGSGTAGQGYIPDVIIDKDSGTLTLTSIISINNDWTVTQGTVDAGTSTIYFGSGNRTITGSHALNNVEFTGFTQTIASGTTLTINGTLTISGSTDNLTFNTGDIHAKGDITITKTKTGSGSATITINGTGDQTLTGPGTVGQGHLPNVNIDKASGTLNLVSVISTAGSTWTYTQGTINAGTSTVFFSSATRTITGSHTLNNVQFNGFTQTISSGTTLTINGTLTTLGSADSLTFNTGNINLAGNVALTKSNTTSGTAVLTFTGSAAQDLSKTAGTWNIPLVINKTNTSDTVTLTSDFSTNSTLTITKGTFSQGASYTLTSGAVTVGANGIWTNTGTGDITLSGNVSNSGTITLKSNNSIVCSDNDDIAITSSVGGTQRTWSGAGTFTLYNLDVTDMTDSSITVYGSTLSNTTWTEGSCTTTTLATGSDPSNSTVAPDSSSQVLDVFTLATDTGTDSVTALTVTSAYTSAIASVSIYSNDLATQYFSTITSPSSSSWSFSGGTAIPVSTTTTSFKVVASFKTHAQLNEGTYPVTGYVSSITLSESQSGSDTAGTTITVDNTPPSNPTWGTNIIGDNEINLNWSNPSDSDFSQVIILRNGSGVGDTPTDGSSYSIGDIIVGSEVAYVGNDQEYDDNRVTNGTSYHYKIFAKDSRGNYSSGTADSNGPYTPVYASSGAPAAPPPAPAPTPSPTPIPTPSPTPTISPTPRLTPTPTPTQSPSPSPTPSRSPTPSPEPSPSVSPSPSSSPLLSTSPTPLVKLEIPEITVPPVIQELPTKVAETVRETIDQVSTKVSQSVSNVAQATQTAVNTISETITTTTQAISNTVAKAATTITETVSQATAKVINTPVVAGQTLVKQLQKFSTFLAEWGRPLIQYAVDLVRPSESATLVLKSGDLEIPVNPDRPIRTVEGFFFNASLEPSQAASKVDGTFKFKDENSDGVWTANIKMPSVPGEFEMNTKITYADGRTEDLKTVVLIDPEGYVYEKGERGRILVPNATVTLRYKDGIQWENWPADRYNQINPQLTKDDGRYSFLAPNGTYYLEVSAPGYETYVGDIFELSEASPVHQVIELKYIGK